MICLHRKTKIGRFNEIRACGKCSRVWVDWEAMGLAQADAFFSERSVEDGYSETHRDLLRRIGATE